MTQRGSEMVNSSERPSERNPSRWDVYDATEVPGATFLQRFKAALLLSDDARGCERLVSKFDLGSLPETSSESRSLDGSIPTVRLLARPGCGNLL
jgi:hypothetical protein